MKKVLSILSVIAIIALVISTAFAADDAKANAAFEELIKLTEKCANNVTYVMETKSKMGDQEMKNVMTFYFKDVKNFRIDSEVQGMKTRMVVTPAAAWTYIEAQKMIMPMDRASVDNMNIREMIEKQKTSCEITEGKDGENKTYTLLDKATKQKTTFTVDGKLGAYSKMSVLNEKGEVMTEAIYKDWKFGAIDESLFKKPEGAQEVKMPEMPKGEQAAPVAPEAPKTPEAPKAPEAPKTDGK
ncbi:MAG TPA: hypothetical protein PKK26_07100 [Candidatus Wallbacteria bacterium]|nr:hypothetical protein [Candidatus Wallbacteria bacterium]